MRTARRRSSSIAVSRSAQKQQVALHQPHRNRVADGFEDAQPGGLGQRLLAAALFLLGLESRHRRESAAAASSGDGPGIRDWRTPC